MSPTRTVPPEPVRVAPVSTSDLVVHGLRTLLEPFRGTIEVDHRTPDVVLLDGVGRDHHGVADVARVHRSAPGVPVVLLTGADDERVLLRALRAGVRGFVLRSRPARDLVDVLVRVARGELVVEVEVAVRAAVLSARLLDLDRSPAALLGLTDREVEVLDRLVDGATARQIGVELYVSHETIRSHLKRIYRKLGVHDRPSAVHRARQEGILPDPVGTGATDGGPREAVRSTGS